MSVAETIGSKRREIAAASLAAALLLTSACTSHEGGNQDKPVAASSAQPSLGQTPTTLTQLRKLQRQQIAASRGLYAYQEIKGDFDKICKEASSFYEEQPNPNKILTPDIAGQKVVAQTIIYIPGASGVIDEAVYPNREEYKNGGPCIEVGDFQFTHQIGEGILKYAMTKNPTVSVRQVLGAYTQSILISRASPAAGRTLPELEVQVSHPSWNNFGYRDGLLDPYTYSGADTVGGKNYKDTTPRQLAQINQISGQLL